MQEYYPAKPPMPSAASQRKFSIPSRRPTGMFFAIHEKISQRIDQMIVRAIFDRQLAAFVRVTIMLHRLDQIFTFWMNKKRRISRRWPQGGANQFQTLDNKTLPRMNPISAAAKELNIRFRRLIVSPIAGRIAGNLFHFPPRSRFDLLHVLRNRPLRLHIFIDHMTLPAILDDP